MKLTASFLLLLLSASSYAANFAGTVVRVTDGDILVVQDDSTHGQVRVRLAGIEAPKRGQAFSDASRRSLGLLAVGQTVAVQWQKRDHNNRIIGKVLAGSRDLGMHQLYTGRAWYSEPNQSELSADDQRAYQEAEESARTKQIGLWQDPAPVPPWKYHKRR
ncbi:MAG: thermonuclease family protein [Gammaproteobacteria bacterium]|nr:thermonuclease family protein [Gammaproteobacteria bacterium]